MEPELLQPRVQAVLFGFRWFVRRGGGARQRQQWRLIPLPTKAGKRWPIVWQDPRLGFVAETGRFVATETPWVRFSCLLLCRCFLLFVFRCSLLSSFFPASRHVYLRVPSSVQQPSATLSKYVFYSTCSFCLLCHLYPTPSRNSFFYSFSVLFCSSYFSGGFFLLCFRTRYASTWFAYLESLRSVWFFCLNVCDRKKCNSLGWRIRKDTGGTADVVG